MKQMGEKIISLQFTLKCKRSQVKRMLIRKKEPEHEIWKIPSLYANKFWCEHKPRKETV